MKLIDLNPRFVGAGGPGIYNFDMTPAPIRTGIGISFDCPCGCGERTFIRFRNPIDGGECFDPGGDTWQRFGDTFGFLTLKPSILRTCACGWHGWLTDGVFKSC